jgi:lambda repressor-like predicted transcriptional regulator
MRVRKLVKEASILVDSYNHGATLRDLAIQFNVSAGTVRTVLKREGAIMRSKGRKRSNTPVTV